MTYRSQLLAGAALAPALALLLTATPAAAQLLAVATPAGPEKAIATLLEQASYWRQQNRPDQVVRALERVLAVDPRNPEALAQAAQAQAQLGNRAAADALIARLRAAAPPDQRLLETDVAVRVATVDQDALREARRLAQAGRGAEAVAQYRALFRSPTPPDSYAQEFYATLAGTPGGFEEARAGLARLAERAPGDARLQLAYAQVLTYRDTTRADGIARLRRLATGADANASATNAWRQALLWAGPNPAMTPELEAFLARNPNDPAITQRLEEIRAPRPAGPADAASTARQHGFDLLNANRARDAGRDFEAAIAANPEDADATGGLGIVRLREGRYGEARSLLERAIRLDPAKRAQWQKALDGAGYAADLAGARSQIQAGQLDAAEQSLRRALSRDAADRADAEALLGDVALRRGDAAGAEARYRAALARRPNLAGAVSGLYEALQQQGRFAEAEALQGRLRQDGSGGRSARANQLRAEASRANDPEDQLVRLREALTLDPGSPWIRLDLARLLVRQGQQAEARDLMGALQQAGGAEALHAAALFAEEDGRPNDAAAYINRIPARQRTADMNRALAHSRVAAEAERAAASWRMGDRAEGRAALIALAARPDPTGGGGALAVRTLGALGDAAGAAQAGRAAIAANAAAPASARLAIAGALLGAGAEREAAQIARSVESQPGLSAEDRRQAAALQTGFAIRTADRLNEQGNQAAAYEALAPVLGRDPTNPAANLALARLYQGARQPDQAAEVAEAVLRDDPRSMDARMAALDAAIAQRDWSRAEALLVDARAYNPNDARVPLMEAKIARAGGNSGRALRALERAQDQLRGQGKLVQVAAPMGAAPANPFRGAAPAAAAAIPGTDPVASEVARELAAVRDEASARIQGALAMRFRSGTGGLDRLSDVSAPLSASLPLGALGGRLTATVTPVTISSGQLDNGNLSTLRSFGSNMLQGSLYQPAGQAAGPSQAVRDRYTPRDDSATGVGFGLAYARNAFTADVGTTPLGFREQNVIGGVEIAPALSNTLKLRLTGERRAMTDSLLSWSGMRDTNSGRTWGGVVRTGGRAQLEIGTQPISFYVGGGYSSLDGSHVAKNNRIEAGAGASWVVYRQPDEELVAGLDLVYFAYDKNQRLFSYGNGGYFSPQSYTAALFPVDWRARSGNLAWRLGGTIGYQAYRENAAKYFPLDAGMQAQADLAAAADPTLRSSLPASSNSGISGGVRGDIEYSVTPNLRLGALLRYDRTANWNEARGLVYARYRFDK